MVESGQSSSTERAVLENRLAQAERHVAAGAEHLKIAVLPVHGPIQLTAQRRRNVEADRFRSLQIDLTE